MSTSNPSTEHNRPSRLSHWLASRQGRLVVALVVLLIVAGVVIGVTDPFRVSGQSSAGITDNSYPTSVATVAEQSLSSQTQVDATLGYAGSYSVSIPSGTATATLTADQANVQADLEKVAADERSLSNAEALVTPDNAATLLADEATVQSDTTALVQAKTQLTSDRRLGCPASSSATVTSLSSSGPSSGSGNGSDGSAAGGGSAAGDGSAAGGGVEDTSTGPPSVTTGSASVTSSTSATVSGTVNPNGSDTSYAFEYGATASFSKTTSSENAGAGTSPVSVSANVSGLRPGTTYDFALVATSAAGTALGATQTFQTVESSCVEQAQVVSQDEEALKTANDTLAADRLDAGSGVTQDEQGLASDEQALHSAEQTLSVDETRATNPGTTFTALPAVGEVLHRGSPVYWLDGHPVPLFYGAVIPDRALYLGVSNGPDVTELQANLIALGFGNGISASPYFSTATEQAVKAWQASLGAPQTGVVALGDFVLEPGSIQVDTVSANLGQAAQPGAAVLSATSTQRVVTIALDAAQQSEVKVGDPVTITLPDNATTPGVVSLVGTVATASSSSATGNTGASATISVEVTPTDPSATGSYDQAPVEVSITNASVAHALVVPVDALLALASGGYALEEIGRGGVHHLVAVSLGLFDDADGLVQVSGPGVAAGQRVVVPAL